MSAEMVFEVLKGPVIFIILMRAAVIFADEWVPDRTWCGATDRAEDSKTFRRENCAGAIHTDAVGTCERQKLGAES